MSTLFGWCNGVKLEKNLAREAAAVRGQGSEGSGGGFGGYRLRADIRPGPEYD